MIRWHVVSAVFWRNVKQYFSGPLGYLFIVVFVTVCAVMAFSPRFFADNLANLDQLSRWFPMLLLFFVPAITMTFWADERRQGTDSILFTLPASDLDILLGKYLAVAAVYSIALLFSTTQLIVLAIIGNPDWGVIFATYLGYWLTGLALLSIGMFASSLTKSATVAFVLGALLCAIPVLIGNYFRGIVGIERLGVDWNLNDFTLGLIPLPNVIYFIAMTIFMLYLNLVVISRRHWYRGEQLSLGSQYLVRAISLAVALVAFCFLCNTAISGLWTRADLTAEDLYTLDDATLEILEKIKDSEQAVTIQAFVSLEVPRDVVSIRKQFVGLLRQFETQGGNNVTLRFVDVLPLSKEAIEAETSGIEARRVNSEVGGVVVEQDVYLGALITSEMEDVTIPVVDNDTAIEYELTRALATTVDKAAQLRLGILETDTFIRGPEIEGRRPSRWTYTTTLNELDKNFNIEFIDHSKLAKYMPQEDANPVSKTENQKADESDSQPEEESSTTDLVDVLLVPDPSSLDATATDVLVKYIEAGNPVVILADPLPFWWTFTHPTRFGVINAPRQPRVSLEASPYARYFASSSAPKADNGTASKILKAIGVEWDNGTAVWSLHNPRPNFKGEWPDEYLGKRWPSYYGPREKALVFVRDHGDTVAFNDDSEIAGGLSELLFFYPGSVRKSADSQLDFQPLVRLGKDSGATPWDELTMTPVQQVARLNRRTGEMTLQNTAARNEFTGENLTAITPAPRTTLDETDHVVAARITGSGESSIDVVFIADLDFISELYPTYESALGETVDNLAFLQNAIEVLAGNTSFVSLRNRRSQPRSLIKLESVFEQYRTEAAKKQEEAEKKIRDQKEKERTKLKESTQEIQADESMGLLQKLQRTSQEASDAQRRFNMRKNKLDRELSQTIKRLETSKQNKISAVQNWTRYTSILTAPLPAMLLGICVLLYRYSNEQKNIAPDRKV